MSDSDAELDALLQSDPEDFAEPIEELLTPQQILKPLKVFPDAFNRWLTCSEMPQGSVAIGVDEAGRGSCIGPLVYGAAAEASGCRVFKKCGANDSKALTHEGRLKIAEAMVSVKGIWDVGICHPGRIDHERMVNLLSLNDLSYTVAFDLVEVLLLRIQDHNDSNMSERKVTVERVMFDLVGPPAVLLRAAERFFCSDGPMRRGSRFRPDDVLERGVATFETEAKADASYAEVGAASIWAKLTRDWFNYVELPHRLENWRRYKRILPPLDPRCLPRGLELDFGVDCDWGSGYPHDSAIWISRNLESSVLGFPIPDFIRWSWKNISESKGPLQIIW